MSRFPFSPAPCLALFLALAGCGGQQYTPGIRLALDGPDLAVAMQGETTSWRGRMERGCMAGVGAIRLYGTDGTACEGEMDHPASDKGRLYADLACTDGRSMALVFRNLGPDQGMGLGRMNPETDDGEKTTFFYHPSPEEAERRLAEVRAEIAAALEKKRNGAILPPVTAGE